MLHYKILHDSFCGIPPILSGISIKYFFKKAISKNNISKHITFHFICIMEIIFIRKVKFSENITEMTFTRN